MGCHRLLHFRQILYHLSHQGSPRKLNWVAYPFSKGTSWPRNWTRISCTAGRFFTSWATQEAPCSSLANSYSSSLSIHIRIRFLFYVYKLHYTLLWVLKFYFYFCSYLISFWGFPGRSVVRDSFTCQCRRCGFHPWVGRSPGEGNGNPPQYSCLGNSIRQRNLWATIHEVNKRIRHDWANKQHLSNLIRMSGCEFIKYYYYVI